MQRLADRRTSHLQAQKEIEMLESAVLHLLPCATEVQKNPKREQKSETDRERERERQTRDRERERDRERQGQRERERARRKREQNTVSQ